MPKTLLIFCAVKCTKYKCPCFSAYYKVSSQKWNMSWLSSLHRLNGELSGLQRAFIVDRNIVINTLIKNPILLEHWYIWIEWNIRSNFFNTKYCLIIRQNKSEIPLKILMMQQPSLNCPYNNVFNLNEFDQIFNCHMWET